MSETTISQASQDRRRHRRFRLPGRPQLGWLLAGAEALAVLAGLAAGAGLGWPAALAGALAYLPLAYWGWYGFLAGSARRRTVLANAALGWGVALAAAGLVALVAGHAIPTAGRVALALVLGLACAYGARAGLCRFFGRLLDQGRLQLERVAVVGAGADIMAFLDKGKIWKRGLQPSMLLPRTGTGDREALEAFLVRSIEAGCTRFIFLGDAEAGEAEAISDLCKRFSVDAAFLPVPGDGPASDPRTGLPIAERPIGFTGTAMKRGFDLVVAGAGLALVSPVMLAAALAIRLESPGPVLFRQERRGFNGKSFTIYKFRSMRVMEDGRAMRQAQRDDPRITRVGALMRSTSIDELPQLFNVLKGEMSLIGPRPHAISHDSEMARIVGQYAHRNRLKPGISGWAQVNGFRGDTSTLEKIEGRVRHDLYYIENWSILLDIAILFRTVFSRKTRENAY